MTSFTFDVPETSAPLSEEQQLYQRILLQKARNLQESARLEREEEERRAAQHKSQVVTFRMPTKLLEGIDLVAASAATSRGHLLRQIATDYLNYVREQGIVYKGTLLSIRKI